MNWYKLAKGVSGTVAIVVAATLVAFSTAYGVGWTPPETWRIEVLLGVAYLTLSVGAIGVPVISLWELEAGSKGNPEG